MSSLRRILNEYDPEHDVGMITWQDQVMADEIVSLKEKVKELTSQLEHLSEVVQRLSETS